MHFKPITEDNYSEVVRIYEQGIATGNSTFQTKAYSWEEWDKGHMRHHRILAVHDGQGIGWVALSPVSSRCVYSGVAELGIYIAEAWRGKGVGSLLMLKVIEESEAEGIWTLQSGIFPENEASLKLHKKHGFREVGYREKIGQMNGIWRDSILLERRSKKL